jgi:hypothetical protein
MVSRSRSDYHLRHKNLIHNPERLIFRLSFDSTAKIIYQSKMHHIMIGVCSLALVFSGMEPVLAKRTGVPGRRVGGGSRWTQQPNLAPTAIPKQFDFDCDRSSC